ncbi:hydroxymethylglutaryl-CoA lyase [Xanthobacter sp. TB0136]|uniref:hydroxymethylglutaryl-CoA lyase n=1 Tax=Xanthobacter sp. TB0136 TaxID=3459177 RepID=UPI00403A4A8E
MSDAVRIIEVGPRDGLQNEASPLSVGQRVHMIEGLIRAGVRIIEVGSFVSPKWVPQMAGSDEVLKAVSGHAGIDFPVLAPNLKGYEAAVAAGAREIAVFASASESFSQKNINCSIAESLERFTPIFERAPQDGVKLRGYVSCAFGCPYEGDIAAEAVVSVSRALHERGCYEIAISDTIGTGTVRKVRRVFDALSGIVPLEALALHEHNTYGQALACILTAYELGVRSFDASVGGLGGCPYAKGATGNVATEEVVFLLEGLGVNTGIDLKALAAVGLETYALLGKTPSSGLARALLSR